MDRRTLLKCLLATPMAALVDYEQLLWVPKPIVTVTVSPRLETLDVTPLAVFDRFSPYDEMLATTQNYCQALNWLYRRENAFLSYLVNKEARGQVRA
jgi:hypothetical protein